MLFMSLGKILMRIIQFIHQRRNSIGKITLAKEISKFDNLFLKIEWGKFTLLYTMAAIAKFCPKHQNVHKWFFLIFTNLTNQIVLMEIQSWRILFSKFVKPCSELIRDDPPFLKETSWRSWLYFQIWHKSYQKCR